MKIDYNLLFWVSIGTLVGTMLVDGLGVSANTVFLVSVIVALWSDSKGMRDTE